MVEHIKVPAVAEWLHPSGVGAESGPGQCFQWVLSSMGLGLLSLAISGWLQLLVLYFLGSSPKERKIPSPNVCGSGVQDQGWERRCSLVPQGGKHQERGRVI